MLFFRLPSLACSVLSFPFPFLSLSLLWPLLFTTVLPVARWGSAAKLATGRAGNPPRDSARREQREGQRHTPVGVPSTPLHSAAGGRSVRPHGVRRRTAQTQIPAPPNGPSCRELRSHGDERHTAGCASLRLTRCPMHATSPRCTGAHGPKNSVCLSFLPPFSPKLLTPSHERSQSESHGAETQRAGRAG
jgi:hypothetical protein